MRASLDRKALLALLIPFATLACSSGTGGGTDGGGGDTGTGGTTTTTTEGGGGTGTTTKPMECEGPGYGGNEQDLLVGSLTASIIDQNGNPAASTSAQVCGTDLCFAETTNASGSVTVVVNDTLKQPAFKYGDGITYVKLAVLIPAGDSMFNNVVTSLLPPVGQGDAFAPGASVASNGITIDIPTGGAVEVDGLIYPEDIDQVFRAVPVPIGANVPAIDASLGFEIVIGVAPVETVFCPPAKVHVPNTPQWAPGAAVEFFIHGVDGLQHWEPYAGWIKASDGVVSEDGTEVVTSDGQGLPVLDTFGVRLKN